MSSRMRSSTDPVNSSDKTFAVSVLPTPLVPRNKKTPIGRLGFLNPVLERMTASAIEFVASDWSITFSAKIFFKLERRSNSWLSASFPTFIS